VVQNGVKLEPYTGSLQSGMVLWDGCLAFKVDKSKNFEQIKNLEACKLDNGTTIRITEEGKKTNITKVKLLLKPNIQTQYISANYFNGLIDKNAFKQHTRVFYLVDPNIPFLTIGLDHL
jgi:hypothetical protein